MVVIINAQFINLSHQLYLCINDMFFWDLLTILDLPPIRILNENTFFVNGNQILSIGTQRCKKFYPKLSLCHDRSAICLRKFIECVFNPLLIFKSFKKRYTFDDSLNSFSWIK